MRILYTITLFLCSALLFLVEPMVAKMILPTFGGSPAVWNACMVFFQTVLLLGYLYAHLSTRALGARRQAWVHVAVMLLPLLVLPIAIPAWVPEGSRNPTLLLLALLAVAVGLPFFVLSAGAPLIQRWFADTNDPDARDPYFLYRASNLGSMVGLLGYPAFYERDFTLKQQSLFWSVGYFGLVVLVACAVAFLWRSPKAPPARETDDAPAEDLTWALRLKWIALAAVPSSLLLGVTTYLTTNLTPVPLLWVVPLALYLLTFVIAFSRRPWLSGAALARIVPLIVAPMTVAVILESSDFFIVLSCMHLAMFFVAALMCHTLLAESRPHPKHLTEFYLLISVGGMLGGVFNALVAPVVFKTVAEYPIAIVLACLLRPKNPAVKGRRLWDFAYPALLGAASIGVILVCYWLGKGPSQSRTLITIGIPAILAFVVMDHPIRFGLTIGVLFAVANMMHVSSGGLVVLTERSFFGVHRVIEYRTFDWQEVVNGEVVQRHDGVWRDFVHGTTLHGMQNFTPNLRHTPLTYYYPTGPIGKVFKAYSGPYMKKEVALVGLGTGSLAAYGKPGQRLTFFEIDPVVQYIARDSGLFTYLQDCQAPCRIVLGDARLKLAQEPDHLYGLIVLDAFSSDSIPVHLLTREALRMYLSKLADDGIVVFHISNRYLDLHGVLANAAAAEGLECMSADDSQRDSWPEDEVLAGKSPSKWVLMARSKQALARLAGDDLWGPLPRDPNAPTWTDDFSNVLSVFGAR